MVDSAVDQENLVDLAGITRIQEEEGESVSDVEGTQKKDEQPRDREGKFLLYWMTTTSTSTTFTATTTVSSLACTPSGFVISNCSG